MTLLIRLATSAVLFVFFFVVVYFAICLVGGAVSGGMAGAGNPDPQAAMQAGQEAGANFVKNHMGAILLGSFLTSAALSLGLSFSGVLPWCKKRVTPPPL